jgi:hypothetical protein
VQQIAPPRTIAQIIFQAHQCLLHARRALTRGTVETQATSPHRCLDQIFRGNAMRHRPGNIGHAQTVIAAETRITQRFWQYGWNIQAVTTRFRGCFVGDPPGQTASGRAK